MFCSGVVCAHRIVQLTSRMLSSGKWGLPDPLQPRPSVWVSLMTPGISRGWKLPLRDWLTSLHIGSREPWNSFISSPGRRVLTPKGSPTCASARSSAEPENCSLKLGTLKPGLHLADTIAAAHGASGRGEAGRTDADRGSTAWEPTDSRARACRPAARGRSAVQAGRAPGWGPVVTRLSRGGGNSCGGRGAGGGCGGDSCAAAVERKTRQLPRSTDKPEARGSEPGPLAGALGTRGPPAGPGVPGEPF